MATRCPNCQSLPMIVPSRAVCSRDTTCGGLHPNANKREIDRAWFDEWVRSLPIATFVESIDRSIPGGGFQRQAIAGVYRLPGDRRRWVVLKRLTRKPAARPDGDQVFAAIRQPGAAEKQLADAVVLIEYSART